MVVDHLRGLYRFTNDPEETLAVLHNKNRLVHAFYRSGWIQDTEGMVLSRSVTSCAGMTAKVTIIAQTRIGFLSGPRRFAGGEEAEDAYEVQREEAAARATVALTRAKELCVILGPLVGLIGAAVIGSLMYGVGLCWQQDLEFHYQHKELGGDMDDEQMVQLLKASKDKSQLLVFENNAIKVAAPASQGPVDTSSEIALQWALQRRGIAMDQCRIVEWSTHQLWVQQLLTTLRKNVPEGFQKVRIDQLIRADKEIFTILANEHRGNIRQDAAGVMPIDVAFRQLRTDPRVIMHILPSVKSKGASSSEKPEGGPGNQNVERPTKKPKAKKPPTKEAAAMCPAELKDHHQRDENDENICWAFNLKGGCKEKAVNHKCKKGVHKGTLP